MEESPEETTTADEEYSIYGASAGVAMDNRENIIETLFNTDKRLELLEHSWSGHAKVPSKDGKTFYWKDTGNSLAGAKFINKQIAAFRAIINETNSFTRKTSDECQRILYDSVKAFVTDMVNDKSLKKRDYRTLAKTYEHALELFLGLVEGGHGGKVLRDALAGLNTPDKPREDKSWYEKFGKK